MRFKMYGKIIGVMSAGLVFALCAHPLQVSAAENIMPAAGVAALRNTQLSVEEYIELAAEAKEASWGYTNLGIANVSSGNLNVRKAPSLQGKLVGKMPKNSACEIIETTEDGWAHITSGEVEGYVSMEYLLTGPDAWMKAEELAKTVVIADVDALNVREEPSTDSAVMTQVLKNEELEYVETLEDWIKVSIDGEDAYVAAEYVTVKDKLSTAITMTELLYGAGVSDVRVELVEYAKQFVGNPYVWGGTSLTKGADCSGFVLSIYKKFGVKMPHYTVSQSKMGTKIKTSELQPGDLIFYSKNGTINHVAIYIGGGQVIHASSPETGIKISKYNYRTPAKCVRIL